MSKQNNMRSLNWRQRGWRSVGWKNSDVTVEAPADSILHWDADIDAFSEQTGGVHTFNHAVLSPQYQLGADGSYANVGAKPAVDVFDGKRWLRSCGAITNLFNGDTSQARSVSLTNGTVYTLHVFGAGTVSCSYGTATVAEPLKITSTATESVEFTPDGATYWMITATPYPVPYVPPGVTQPASNATTTNGSWFSLPDGSPLWKALDGEIQAQNLITNGSFDTNIDGWNVYEPTAAILSWNNGKLRIQNNGATYGAANQAFSTVVGDTYEVSVDVAVIAGGPARARVYHAPDILAATSINATTPGTYKFRFNATSTTSYILLGNRNDSDAYSEFDNISIQRIQPQPLTLATRVRMGVGSGDIAANTALDGISCAASGGAVMRAQDISGAKYPASSNDGTTSALSPAITWSRNAVMRRFVQVNMAGTQFRVGYMIEGTHTTIQWGSLVAYDGSFGPSTLYKLLLNFNNPTPKWFNKITVWRKQVSDTELLGAWA